MKKLILLVILIFSIPFIGNTNNFQQGQGGKVKDIDVETFSTLIDSRPGNILDVRTPNEWEGGIIEGAIQINFYDDNFIVKATQLNKNKVIYIYCKAGGRSSKAAKQLKEKGYRIFNLLGGFDTWKEAKKPISK